MKKVPLLMRTIVTLVCLVFSIQSFSQNPAKPVQPPFKLGAPLPFFKIMNVTDSTPFENKNLEAGKRTIMIYFGADCGHCTYFAKKLIDSMSLFKNTQIVMASSSEFSHIKTFYDDNKIASCPFITMGRDADYFFVSYYDVRQFPSAYVYDKKGKFVKSFVSEINISELAESK